MNIDFHYGVVFVVARLAGLDQQDAELVAHACQYVDDATTHGILEFAGGETYERFASAHKMLDYKNLLEYEDKLIWVPFHFLPAGEGATLDEKAVCKPDSAIARDMVRDCIESKNDDNSLHRLGVTLHVYVDTWAHQGFTGTRSRHNIVTWLEGDDHDQATWLGKLENFVTAAADTGKAFALDEVSLLGHGSALHFPDLPWAKWHYTNGHGNAIKRDNLPDFLAAADMACRAIQGFIKDNAAFENEPGLPAASKQALHDFLLSNKNDDPDKRLAMLIEAAAAGKVAGQPFVIPEYIPMGPGSWKAQATGILAGDDGNVKPNWSATFETSDYRKFHDAVKEHRFVVTQQILPRHNVRLA